MHMYSRLVSNKLFCIINIVKNTEALHGQKVELGQV